MCNRTALAFPMYHCIQKVYKIMYWNIFIGLQIILETLPVSSSGHLAVLAALVHKHILLSGWFATATLHIMHVPTLLVLALFFGYRWYNYLLYPIRLLPQLRQAILFTGIADAITVLLFACKPEITSIALACFGFAITLIMLGSLYWCPVGSKKITLYDAGIVGLVQAIALLPGISRLASVFVASRWLGYSNRHAFEIAWMIQVPLITVASIKGMYELYRHQQIDSLTHWQLWLTVIGATILSYGTLYFCYWLVRTNRVWWLAWYMLLPLCITLALSIA
jgi:undecaprenyl-diphosphatase